MLKALLPLVALVLLFPFLQAEAQPSGEEITLQAMDGWSLGATLYLPEETGKRPAVILIHQGGSDRSEWAPYIYPLLARGWVVLAYDVRGHGESGQVEDLRALFDDPHQAPKDLEGVIAYLRDHPAVDELRIAAVGSSIGANLAVMANHHYGMPGVAISGKTSAALHLSDLERVQDFDLKGLLFLSSAGDQGGQRARWAEELYALTTEPRQLAIAPDSDAHGVTIFEESPISWERVLYWLKQVLR